MESINFFELKKAENEAKALEIISQFDAGIIITHEPLSIAKFVKPFIILKTKKIVVGLGARKHSPADNIVQAVNASLQRLNIPGSRVNCFATVDIKKTSKPMAEAVERLGASLEFLSVDALRSVSYSDLSPDSAMVQEKIGVGGVSERAALLVAGKNSKLLMKKVKLKGVTVAIAEGE
jgi:cobalt-precorrin 5A hydrolase